MVMDVGCWLLIIPTVSRKTIILNRLLAFLSLMWYSEPLVIFIQVTVYISAWSQSQSPN